MWERKIGETYGWESPRETATIGALETELVTQNEQSNGGLLLSIPVSLSDERRALFFRTKSSRQFGFYPGAGTVFISGNGCTQLFDEAVLTGDNLNNVGLAEFLRDYNLNNSTGSMICKVRSHDEFVKWADAYLDARKNARESSGIQLGPSSISYIGVDSTRRRIANQMNYFALKLIMAREPIEVRRIISAGADIHRAFLLAKSV